MQIVEKITRMLKMGGNRVSRLLLILLCGVCLMIVVWPVGKTDDDRSGKDAGGGEETGEVETAGSGEENMNDSAYTYSAYLEKKLTEVLESMDGISQVSVMITVRDSGEKVTTKDVGRSSSEGEDSSQSSVTEQTVMTDHDGDTAPYITSYIQPQVEGVLVCCKGAEKADISLKITNAVQALFDVPAHKIVILEAN